MTFRLFAVVLAVLTVVNRTVGAQTLTQPASTGRAPIEIAVGIGRLGGWNFFDHGYGRLRPEGVLDFRVTVPVASRFAVEGLFNIGHDSNEGDRAEGIYGVVVQQRFGHGAGERSVKQRPEPFVKYGLVGYWSRVRFPANQVYPARYALFGGGLRQRLGDHVALRADVDVVTFFSVLVGWQASAGVSIPLGRYRVPMRGQGAER